VSAFAASSSALPDPATLAGAADFWVGDPAHAANRTALSGHQRIDFFRCFMGEF
jgi:hypothetical protein